MIKERDAEIENYEEILKGSMADQESGWVGKVAKDGFRCFSLNCFVEFVCVSRDVFFFTNGRGTVEFCGTSSGTSGRGTVLRGRESVKGFFFGIC